MRRPKGPYLPAWQNFVRLSNPKWGGKILKYAQCDIGIDIICTNSAIFRANSNEVFCISAKSANSNESEQAMDSPSDDFTQNAQKICSLCQQLIGIQSDIALIHKVFERVAQIWWAGTDCSSSKFI